MPHSSDVCQHLWERVRHYPETVLGHGPLPHADAADKRVHPLPPDPGRPETKAGGVFSTRLVIHQWHWHERRKTSTLKFLKWIYHVPFFLPLRSVLYHILIYFPSISGGVFTMIIPFLFFKKSRFLGHCFCGASSPPSPLLRAHSRKLAVFSTSQISSVWNGLFSSGPV